jgi:hypothetical protein
MGHLKPMPDILYFRRARNTHKEHSLQTMYAFL